MSPKQALFTFFRVELAKTYPVYDGAMPPESAGYPFIYLAETTQTGSKLTKHTLLNTGRVSVSIHVWVGSTRQRGTLYNIMNEISELARNLANVENYRLIYKSDDHTIIPDTTTGTALLHGVVLLNYEFYENKGEKHEF